VLSVGLAGIVKHIKIRALWQILWCLHGTVLLFHHDRLLLCFSSSARQSYQNWISF
jgi:hypothetical protein